jgi:hypothetical protein
MYKHTSKASGARSSKWLSGLANKVGDLVNWTLLSKISIPWWHLSGVSDTNFLPGVDFRLRLSNDAGLLVSAETARALQTFDSQISDP